MPSLRLWMLESELCRCIGKGPRLCELQLFPIGIASIFWVRPLPRSRLPGEQARSRNMTDCQKLLALLAE